MSKDGDEKTFLPRLLFKGVVEVERFSDLVGLGFSGFGL